MSNDARVTVTTINGKKTGLAFDDEKGADIMVVAIHPERGVIYQAQFDSHDVYDAVTEGFLHPMSGCIENITEALQDEGIVAPLGIFRYNP